MNLVYEEYGGMITHKGMSFCLFNYLTNLLHPGIGGTQGIKRAVQGIGYHPGKGCFTYTRRAPKDHGWDMARFQRLPQRSSRTNNVGLTNVFC